MDRQGVDKNERSSFLPQAQKRKTAFAVRSNLKLKADHGTATSEAKNYTEG
jgi:hypothetical protein